MAINNQSIIHLRMLMKNKKLKKKIKEKKKDTYLNSNIVQEKESREVILLFIN